MTTINSTSKMSKGMILNGNVLSGDTYGMREYIKKYWDGKWNAINKTWTVDANKVTETITNQTWGFCRTLSLSNDAPVATLTKTYQHSDRWLNADGSLAEDY